MSNRNRVTPHPDGGSRHGDRTLACSIALASLIGLMGVIAQPAMATAPVFASALSARIVRFIADPNNTYVVYLHPGMVTDIKLAPGEHLEALALGDSVQWVTQQVPGSGDVFVKPVKAGIETSATLVTNQNSYQMMLVSRKTDTWYQEVRFQPMEPLVYADPQALQAQAQDRAQSPDSAAAYRSSGLSFGRGHDESDPATKSPDALPDFDHASMTGGHQDDFSNLNLKDLRFGWHIKGKAAFRPTRVFSSPDFVWVELPEHSPAPVVFSQQGGKDGPWGIVNYDYRGHWIVVQSKDTSLELRSGGQVVYLYAPRQWKQQQAEKPQSPLYTLGQSN